MPESTRKHRATPKAPRTPRAKAPATPPPAATPAAPREGFARITDFHWGYPFSVVGEGPEADALRDFFARFTTTPAPFTGHGYHVLAPDDHDTAVQAFEKNVPVLYDSDVWAAAGRDDTAEARRARLERVLAVPSARHEGELEMLLATWPAEQAPEAAHARATEAIAAWPGMFLRGGVRAEAMAARGQWEALRPWVRTRAGEALEAGRAQGLLPPADTLFFDSPEAAVADRAALETVRDLTIRGVPTAEAWAVLRTAPQVERLALGDYTGTHPKGFDAALWWDAPLGARLRTLSTYGLRLDAKALKPLGARGDTLRHLRLENARMEGASAGKALAQIAARHPLRSLELSYNDLGPAGAEALFAAPTFAALEALNLSANEIGDAGAVAMARNPSLRALRWLAVRSTTQKGRWTAEAAKALAEADMPALRHLVLMAQGVGSEGAAALLTSSRLVGLRALNLSYCDADWAEVIALCKCRVGPALEALDLSNWSAKKKPRWEEAVFLSTVKHLRAEGVPGGALAGLLRSGQLGSLEALVLGGVYAEHAKAVTALKTVPALPRLKVLSLHGWKLDATAAKALADAPLVAALEGIDLMSGSYATPGAARVFLERGIRLVGSSTFNEYAANDVRSYGFEYEGPDA